MSAEAYIIPRDACARVWPGVAHLIEAAYKAIDEIMPPDILDQLCTGFRQLWVVWGDEGRVLCAGVTRIVQLRSGRALQVMGCGGEHLERWAHLVERIKQYARDEGCKKVQIEGRRGWQRIFREFRVERVVLELEL